MPCLCVGGEQDKEQTLNSAFPLDVLRKKTQLYRDSAGKAALPSTTPSAVNLHLILLIRFVTEKLDS